VRRYDEIVVGAGVNGLIAATRLAMAGHNVLLVDQASHVGGRSYGHRFHEGFSSPGLLSDTSGLRPQVLHELGLTLKRAPQRRAPVTLTPEGLRPVDAEAWQRWQRWIDSVAPVIGDFLDDPPLDLLHPERVPLRQLADRGWELRKLGRNKMRELFRVPPMSAADWLEEWFEHPADRAAIAAEALAGSWLAPRSPGGAFSVLLQRVADSGAILGGTTALIDALNLQARRAGVSFQLDSKVARLRIDGDAVRGVEFVDGESVASSKVLSTVAPNRTMLDWLPVALLPYPVRRRYEAWRCRGTTAQLLLALSQPPSQLATADGPTEFTQTALHPDDIERAFDAVKYRQRSERPVLLVQNASASCPQLAPAGQAVLSVLIHYAPHDLEGGWTDESCEALRDATVELLEERLPGLRASIVAEQLLDPHEIERRYGLPGGQIHHGEQALDQLLIRPEPEALHYRTVVDGLWLGGSGSHPGGSLTGAPGRLASAAMLFN